jgi:hypothetical protein
MASLDLSGDSRAGRSDRIEDVRREEIAANYPKIRWRVLLPGLFDQVHDGHSATREGAGLDHAVGRDVLRLCFLHSHDTAAGLFIDAHHRIDRIGLPAGGFVNDLVSDHHDEGVVTDMLARQQHGVAEPCGLLLTDEADVGEFANLADLFELVCLADSFEVML